MTESYFPAVQCEACGVLYGHEPDICRECQSESLERKQISGIGEVYAQTTIRVPGEDHQDEGPFTVAIVDVGDEERVRVTARIDDSNNVNPTDQVVFSKHHNGIFHFRVD